MNANQAGVTQTVVNYSAQHGAVSLLLGSNGQLKQTIDAVQGADSVYNAWATANRGFLITYRGSFDTYYIDSKGKVTFVKAPADAGTSAGSTLNNGIEVTADKGDNALTVITYHGPTSLAIDSKDKIHTVEAPEGGLQPYVVAPTPNNQMVISYYKEFFMSQYDGHLNAFVVVNPDGSSKVETVPGTENAGGFASATFAGDEVLLFWYDADSYHVYNVGGDDKEVKHYLNSLYAMDGTGQIKPVQLPAGAVLGNNKANSSNYNVETTAKLMAFENTTDLLLIKADNTTQIISAPKGATGVLWITQAGPDFVVTYEDAENTNSSYATLGVVQVVAADGRTYEVQPRTRMTSQSCTNGVCESTYEDIGVIDVVADNSPNFAVRYIDGQTKLVFDNRVDQIIPSGNTYASAHGDFVVGNHKDRTLYYFSETGEKKQIEMLPGAYTFDWVYTTSEGDYIISFRNQEQTYDQYSFTAMADMLFISKDGEQKVIHAPKNALNTKSYASHSEKYGRATYGAVYVNPEGQATIQYQYATTSEPQTTTIITNTGEVKYW